MAKKKIDDVSERQDDIGADILTLINKQFKDSPGLVATYLSDDNISDVTGWIGTTSTELDLAISNRKNGGWPVGRIIEIYGGSASGKSLLAASAMKDTQRQGGIGIYFDTESAISREFFTAIGVDVNKLLIVNLECLEDIFESIENIIERVRKDNRDKIVTIVLDSIMGATTKQELESDYDKDGWNTSKAIILSKAMRKLTAMIARQKVCLILINQIRDKLGVTFGPSTTTSGGKAVGFHSSVRVELENPKKIMGQINGIETAIGTRVTASIKKNRVGPPFRTATFDIYFDRGIDDVASLTNVLKRMGLIKVFGSWSTFEYVKDDELVTKKFQGEGLAKMMRDDPVLLADIKDIIAEKFIMKYNSTQDVETVLEELENYED